MCHDMYPRISLDNTAWQNCDTLLAFDPTSLVFCQYLQASIPSNVEQLLTQNWLTCYFTLKYSHNIHQTGNKNTQTYQVEVVILI